MKNTLKLAFAAAFLLSAWPVSALVINAQPGTKCDYSGYCETKLDVRTFLTAQQAAKLIGQNLTSTLPSLANVQDMKVSLVNSTLTINGTVKLGTSNYWTYNLGGVADIDPWWNTTFVQCVNYTLTYIGANASLYNASMYVNFTKPAGMLASYKDLRFINNSCNNNNVAELEHWDEQFNSTMWFGYLKIDSLVNNTPRTIGIYYNNTSAVSKTSTLATFYTGDDFDDCDNTSWAIRNGGSIVANTTFRFNDSAQACGWKLTNPASWSQAYWHFPASLPKGVNMTYVWYLYSYHAGVSHYFYTSDDNVGTNTGTLFRVSAGQLQKPTWTNIAGFLFLSGGWQKITSSGSPANNSWTMTMTNYSGTFTTAGLGSLSVNGVTDYMFVGEDSTNAIVNGGPILVMPYVDKQASTTIGSVENYTAPLPPHTEAMDTHICFSIRDVCVDTLSGRVWIGGRPQ